MSPHPHCGCPAPVPCPATPPSAWNSSVMEQCECKGGRGGEGAEKSAGFFWAAVPCHRQCPPCSPPPWHPPSTFAHSMKRDKDHWTGGKFCHGLQAMMCLNNLWISKVDLEDFMAGKIAKGITQQRACGGYPDGSFTVSQGPRKAATLIS